MSEQADIGPEAAGPPRVSLRRWLLIVMLMIFNLIDVGITRAVLWFGGEESNPVMKPIIGDVALVLSVKVLVCLAVGALLMFSPPSSKLAERAVAGVVVFYVLVAGWNIGILISQVPRA